MSESIVIRGSSSAATAEVVNNALRVQPYGEWEKALADGYAYSFNNATYNYTAKDTIIGVENNSSIYDLKIKRIIITGDTATQFIVHTASGVTMAGTAITAVNLNRNSSLVATSLATAKGDETGNSAADGYTGRLITGRFADNGIVDLPIDGAIVLPSDHMIGVDFTTVGTAGSITIWGYFVSNT